MNSVYKLPHEVQNCHECIYYSDILGRCMLGLGTDGKKCGGHSYIIITDLDGGLEAEVCAPSIEHLTWISESNGYEEVVKGLKRIEEFFGCKYVKFHKSLYVFLCPCNVRAFITCDKKKCSVMIM